jgi:orotidine-5'-phosphate decarboxylase
MNTANNDARIVVALDYAKPQDALALAARLDPSLCKLKIGKELFTASGPQLVEQLVGRGYDIFLDLKFHDIPTTVGKACEAASRLGVWMLNVHASGGSDMMKAALEGVHRSGRSPLLIAVTVLTSMNQAALNQVGVTGDLRSQVLNLARLTKQSGLHGVVCSAQEAEMLRAEIGAGFCLVTPGIRPKTASLDDQSRVVTPAQAIANGADYLVIGRPITQAEDPLSALQAIHQELQLR